MLANAISAVLAGVVGLFALWGQGALAQGIAQDALEKSQSQDALEKSQSQDAPQRVVSMNLCTDQLAMMLAAQGQLISVSHLALDPHMSAMVQEAGAYEINRGLAEQIYLMQPDLVLAGQYTARASVAMLERLGLRVVTFADAYALEDVRSLTVQMGAVLGQEARAADMVEEFDAQLDAYQRQTRENPSAALYYANGYTVGDKTLAGEILTAAGLENIAAEAGFAGGGIVPLEVLAMAQPDTVITSQAYPAASRSEEVMEHTVVRSLRAGRGQGGRTSSDWVCGTPYVLRAVADMAKLRGDLVEGKP